MATAKPIKIEDTYTLDTFIFIARTLGYNLTPQQAEQELKNPYSRVVQVVAAAAGVIQYQSLITELNRLRGETEMFLDTIRAAKQDTDHTPTYEPSVKAGADQEVAAIESEYQRVSAEVREAEKQLQELQVEFDYMYFRMNEENENLAYEHTNEMRDWLQKEQGVELSEEGCDKYYQYMLQLHPQIKAENEAILKQHKLDEAIKANTPEPIQPTKHHFIACFLQDLEKQGYEQEKITDQINKLLSNPMFNKLLEHHHQIRMEQEARQQQELDTLYSKASEQMKKYAPLKDKLYPMSQRISFLHDKFFKHVQPEQLVGTQPTPEDAIKLNLK